MAKQITKRGRKPGTSTVPADESKADKFVRLAQKRVSKVINALRQVGQLSGAGYDSTPAQVEKMYRAISDAATEGFNKFGAKGSKAAKETFTL